jgi:predicted SAM-dependent methyltransferase
MIKIDPSIQSVRKQSSPDTYPFTFKRKSAMNPNHIKELSGTFKRYNLGCGTMLYEGFLNVGFWSQLEKDAVYRDLNGTRNTFMLNHDLTEGIPAEDDSLDLVYHSHMLEHLSFKEGIAFTQECFRVLRPGGVIRILVPDLELFARAYLSRDEFFLGEYRKNLDPTIHSTPASVFMGMLHNHGHKMGYDFETLRWLLLRSGFVDVRRTLYSDSAVEGIELIEPRSPGRAMESLCVESRKP